MYKIVYETDNGKLNATGYKDAKNFDEMIKIVDELKTNSCVTDIYICRQIQYINAYQERKCNLSNIYGMVVR